MKKTIYAGLAALTLSGCSPQLDNPSRIATMVVEVPGWYQVEIRDIDDDGLVDCVREYDGGHGIIQWAAQGYQQYCNRGLAPKVLDETNRIRLSSAMRQLNDVRLR